MCNCSCAKPEKVKKIVMEYTPPFRVTLEYYKESGKYYSGGEYMSEQLHMFEIVDEAKSMLKNGKRPGLVDGVNDFYVVVEAPEHPHNHPALIFPTVREDWD